MVFCLVDRKGGLDIQWAAWLALGAGLLIFCVQARRGQNDLFYAGILFVFGALLIAHTASGPAAANFIETHGRGLVSAGMGVVLLMSVLTGRPVCDAAARRAIPPWASRTFEFRQLVRRTTLRWAAAMFGLAGLFAATAMSSGPVGKTLFGWLAPLALCLIVVNIDLSSWRQFSTSVQLADDRRHLPATSGARLPYAAILATQNDDAESLATVYAFSSYSALARES